MTTLGYAKKIGMTRIFVDGVATAVTALQMGDNAVLQHKTPDTDGYSAIQMGFFAKKTTSPKARTGHVSKHASTDFSDFYVVSEFRDAVLPEGATQVVLDSLTVGEGLDLQATSKGRGFQGVVKRHGFKGQPRSHGHDHVRHGGSIGSRWPQRVMPGKKMAGQMGNVTVTVKNLTVVAIDLEKNLFFVAGSVPGPNTGYVRFVTTKHA